MRATYNAAGSPPKISETFRASSFVSLGFFLCSASTRSPQTPDRHWLGCFVARFVAVGHLLWLGPSSGAHDREHGRSGVDDRSPPACAHAAAENAAPKNTRPATAGTHQHSTRHHPSGRAPCRSTHCTGYSHGSGHSSWRTLRQARLPQRFASHGRRRHGDAEVFDWCRWQSTASRH